VAPGAICKLPAPSLKIVRTSLVALKLASTVEAVVLVKLEVVTAVPWTAKVLAVTVPIWFVPAGMEGRFVTLACTNSCPSSPKLNKLLYPPPIKSGSDPIVTEFPTVTEEMEMG